MDKVADSLTEQVSFYHVDTDSAPDLAERFGIQAIPMLIRFVDGKNVGQKLGYQSEAAVRQFANEQG